MFDSFSLMTVASLYVGMMMLIVGFLSYPIEIVAASRTDPLHDAEISKRHAQVNCTGSDPEDQEEAGQDRISLVKPSAP